MNKKLIIFTMLAAILVQTACKKNTDVFIPDPGQPNGPDLAWYATITDSMQVNVLRRNLLTETIKDSIEVNNNIAVLNSTANGITLNFSPNCCVNPAGLPVTGKVYVELLLLKKKGDMIRNSKPTVNNGKLLITGGQVFIRLIQNGQELHFSPNGKVQVRFTDTPPNFAAKLYFGDESVPDRFNWLQADTSLYPLAIASNTAYEFYTNKLRWNSCNSVYPVNGVSLVRVTDSLPANFTNANSVSYIVFSNIRSVVAMNADINQKTFFNAEIPAGLPATIVVISKQANDYYLAHENITTGLQGTVSTLLQKVKLTPVKTPLADIKGYLGNL